MPAWCSRPASKACCRWGSGTSPGSGWCPRAEAGPGAAARAAPRASASRAHRVAGRLEGVAFVPVRPAAAIGQVAADAVQHLEVLDDAVQVPGRVELVGGLVVRHFGVAPAVLGAGLL